MLERERQFKPTLPFKSVAGALLFGLFLGPIGLLYASTLGGLIMLVVNVLVLPTKLPMPIILVWFVIPCIWSVIAAKRYNKKIIEKF